MAPAEPDEPERQPDPWGVYISGKPNQTATTTFTDIQQGVSLTFPSATRIAEFEAKIAELERREQNRHAHEKRWDKKNAAVNIENARLRAVLKETEHKLHILELERDLDVTYARRLELANKRIEMIRDLARY